MKNRRLFHGRARVRALICALCAVGAGLLLLPGASLAAGPVSLTKTNDANHDGVYSSSETIPASAVYPWTVSYQLTLFGGSSGGPLGPFHTITSITDDNTTDLGTCAALINTTIAVGATETCTYSVTLTAPSVSPLVNTATMTFDSGGGDSRSNSSTVNFPPLTVPGGTFVIGNLNSAIGTSVTFWGAQWWKLNSLTGGAAPASFKGFEDTPASPGCGTNWSTDTGNSTPPPAGPLPNYMLLIVSSGISQTGSTIAGDTQHLVIVRTNAGYAPNPGHAGTGTIVATVC